ncbi:glutamine-synthetase adenylyltransferase [Citreimonas salinaria]|uniref:Glutamate-ammonia-ligase adenylyltransferase n=1 Tax=Citreimonas salinaria TaxID=321339 RepID=A0A1H3GGD5_9RHOB|nr:glutamine-synthetase adenylyltransferase [Citreimonas salinaria]SDY01564.1 glutamate-ammonia-ligase adenylyltransferase [Citreimonas salinaria]
MSAIAITHLPRPFDPDRGAEARAAAPWASGDVAALIEGAGGSSPYLKSLVEKEAEWLGPALDDPDAALAAQAAALSGTAHDALPDALRQAKRRMALLVGLCDLAGAWPLERVTEALTRFADMAVDLALRACVGREIARGKLPGQTEADIAQAGGMVVLAMGKMGAFELNYSSDIDLICLFDETRFGADDYHEARASLVRATRKMTAMLSDMTGAGYVLRTDLRLRPDPAVTPVCMSMEAAERYYESLGRTWERAAYIKARPCAGDMPAGNRFLETLTPFVWRKHLDFAAIQDAHDMRLRIRAHKGLGGPITLPEHDMKLGRGGIREIEFFTQTRQLIAGGRDPDLRTRGTVPGLSVLADKGWLPRDVADTLADHYRAHRTVEHRLQMIADAQTHMLPRDDDGFARLACLMGVDEAEMRADLKRRLTEVHDLTEGFFAPDAGGDAGDEDLPEALRDSDLPARWPSYPALRSSRATEIFARLEPEILRRLAATARPEEALDHFDGFLRGLPAGVQLFSLFEANPQLIDLLVDIVGTSADLGHYLARNAEVLDAVIGGDFFDAWPGRAALHQGLAGRLGQEEDYERQLDMARRWWREWHFRVGVHLLRGLMGPEEAGRAYADLADATVAALWPVVQAQFSRKHGPPPGRGAAVLGMGSLGAGRLHARSDLDLIVIYDATGDAASDGPRPLSARPYYARLTQALITALTAQTAEGRLYEVDMRLRPSGKQGPVATALPAFRSYQAEEAWTWEHLALTRARVLAGPADLGEEIEALRRELLSAPRDRDTVLRAVADMRARIGRAKGRGDPWDLKIGPGRMQDIELLAQAAALVPGPSARQVNRALRRADWLDDEDRAALIRAYELHWAVQIGARLVSDKALDPETLGAQGCAFLTRIAGVETMSELKRALDDHAARAGAILTRVLPDPEEGA